MNEHAMLGLALAAQAASVLLDFREEIEGVAMGIYSTEEKAQILEELVKKLGFIRETL